MNKRSDSGAADHLLVDGYYDIPKELIEKNALLQSWVPAMRGRVSRQLAKLETTGSFRLVASSGYNAFAQRSSFDDGSNVGVHDPVPWINRYVPFELLSCSRFFGGIGDASLEQGETTDWSKVQWTRRGIENLRIRPPVCPIRLRFAERIANAIDMFIVDHEMAHIAARHLEVLHGQGFGATIIEGESLDDLDNQLALRRAMEYEADTVSIIIILESVPETERSATTFEAILIGAAIFMCLISTSSSKIEFDSRATHPHPLYRVMNVTRAASEAPTNPINANHAQSILNTVREVVLATGWLGQAVLGYQSYMKELYENEVESSRELVAELRNSLGLVTAAGWRHSVSP